MGAGSAATTGGGAFPFPLPMDPQALKLPTASTAIATVRSLLMKVSSPHYGIGIQGNDSSNSYKTPRRVVHKRHRVNTSGEANKRRSLNGLPQVSQEDFFYSVERKPATRIPQEAPPVR
jgi:hypothetical protein